MTTGDPAEPKPDHDDPYLLKWTRGNDGIERAIYFDGRNVVACPVCSQIIGGTSFLRCVECGASAAPIPGCLSGEVRFHPFVGPSVVTAYVPMRPVAQSQSFERPAPTLYRFPWHWRVYFALRKPCRALLAELRRLFTQ